MAKPVIFLAFANDRDDRALYLRNLPEELRQVKDRLDHHETAKVCEVVIGPNTTVRELLDVFQDPRYRDRVAIFHFAGHAGGYQLLLESAEGRPELAHAAGLADFLGHQRTLQLVFLNGCSTQPQVEALLHAGVPAVIATTESVVDSVAMELSARFYAAVAGGASIGTAYAEAVAAVKTLKGDQVRDLYRTDAGDSGRWPWDLYVNEGADIVREWSLPRAAGDPLFGLPPLPEQDLPNTPYRHLQWFRAEDAELFFGRGQDIRTFYDLLTSPSAAPIVLFYGQSGVGKSSMLAAGVLPRLATHHQVRYERRQRDLGLTSTFALAIGAGDNSDTAVRTAWQTIESESGQPLVVILDQVEEVYTRPRPVEPAELERFLGVLASLFAERSSRPRGKLVLGFRRESLADIEARVVDKKLFHSKHYLKALDKDGIMEIVHGPERSPRLRTHFKLTVVPELAALISHDLLKDQDAPVAPTLEVLLTKMWKQAAALHPEAPTFTVALYRELSAKGGLDDFVEEQLDALRNWNASAVDTGFALDLLAFHTTPLGTAESRTRAELDKAYPHQSTLLPDLLQQCKDVRLLVDYVPALGGENWVAGSRLAHDTLAPLVQHRFAASDRPGQRARRILEYRARDWTEIKAGSLLDETDLLTVEQGAAGMRAWTSAEQQLIRNSRRVQRIMAGVQHWDPLARALVVTSLKQYPTFPGRERLARLAAESVLPIAVLCGHEGPVWRAAFSPDGSRVVTASSDRTARVWRADGTGEPVVLRGHEGSVSRAGFSADGSRVVTASSDRTARVWRADGAGEPVVLRGHKDRVTSAAFSPDGSRVVTGSEDGTARVWRADGAGEPVVLRGHEKAVTSAIFSPDGSRVVTGSEDGTARVWRADGAGEPVVLRGHEKAVTSAVFSPGGSRVVTASPDGTARVWRADGAGELVVLRGHEHTVTSAAFSPDGSRVITASEDRTARVWPAHGAGEPVVLRHEEAVWSAAFSPDGRQVVTASGERTARVWRADGFGAAVVLRHENRVVSAVFSPDGRRVVTASIDRTAKVWRADGGGEPVVLRGHDGPVSRAVFSADGSRVVTASEDGTARVWRVDGAGEPVVLRGHEEAVWSAAFGPDGSRVVTASEDRTARVWRADGAGELVVLRGHEYMLTGAAFSPDGRRVVTASWDATARVWRTDGAGKAVVLRDHQDTVRSAVFSPDGSRVVTASEDRTARLWRADGTGEPVVLRGHEDTVTSAAFSPGGSRVVTASEDGTARVWRADGAGEPVVLRGHEYTVTSAAFSPDGSRVVTSSDDRTARVWRADGGGEPVVLRGHEEAVTSAVFSPDGSRVVTASEDRTARVWRADGAGEPVVLRGHEATVRSAVFSPDGSRVVTASADKTLRVWRLSWTLLLEFLEQATTACLTPNQRRELLGESDEEARAAYEACERSFGRNPAIERALT